MSRMGEISKALLLENRGNIDGSRFLYSIGLHDGTRAKHEFQNIDFQKLEDIDDAELKKMIEFLSLIGEDWCVEYLGKFLLSGRYYDERQDYMENHHHVWAMEALSKFEPKDIESHIIDYLSKLDFDIPMGSCDSDMYFNIGTSYYAYEIAMEIGVKNKFSGIELVLKTFLPALSWATHGFGAAEAKWLAELKGLAAFDDLVGYLIWHHRKYECWEQVDDRVVEAIVSIGPDVIQLLAKHVYIEGYSLNQGTLEALEKLGADPTDYIDLSASNQYELNLEELEFLRDRSLQRMHEKFVNFLNYSMYDLNNLPDLISKLKLPIDKRIMMGYLNEKSTIQGACRYFQEFPTPEVIKPLSAALSVPPDDPYVAEEIIRVLTKCGDPDLLTKMLKWSSDLLSLKVSLKHTPLIEILSCLDETINWIASEQGHMIEPIETCLKSKSEDDRIVAVLFICLLSVHPTGLKALQDAGFTNIIQKIFTNKSASEFRKDLEDVRAFHDKWIDRIEEIAEDLETLEDALRLKDIIDNVDTKDVVAVANQVKLSNTPWEILLQIKDRKDLDDPILQTAVIESIPSILNGMSTKETFFEVLEKIISVDYLLRDEQFLDGLTTKLVFFKFEIDINLVFNLVPPLVDSPVFHSALVSEIEETKKLWAKNKYYERKELFEAIRAHPSLTDVKEIRTALLAVVPEFVSLLSDCIIHLPFLHVMSAIIESDMDKYVAKIIEETKSPLVTIIEVRKYFRNSFESPMVHKAVLSHSRYFANLLDEKKLEIEGLLNILSVIHSVPELAEDKKVRKSLQKALKNKENLKNELSEENLLFMPHDLMDKLVESLLDVSRIPAISEDRSIQDSITDIVSFFRSRLE